MRLGVVGSRLFIDYGYLKEKILETFSVGEIDTIVSGGTRPVSHPLGTVTTKDRFALLEYSNSCNLDILFRMLKPHELKMGQGFPRDYQILGNISEQVKQIGNAVPPGTAKALAKMAMRT